MAQPKSENFTDFMIRSMESEDDVEQAMVIIRKKEGIVGYRCFNQEFSDTLGMLRFAQILVEEDLVSGWESKDI